MTRAQPAVTLPTPSHCGQSTAIPARYPSERNRVLAILARWEDSEPAERSLLEGGR
ncbi:MAG: hypothetical protein R2909_23935 [Gemmatimonadales bacterium]